MITLKSLRRLHQEAGHKIFKAQSANGSVAIILGIAVTDAKIASEERAYGYLLEENPSSVPPKFAPKTSTRDYIEQIKTFDADRVHWQLWTEPKPVPHWPALRKISTAVSKGGVGLGLILYPSEEAARAALKDKFIRLLKEYPPVDLVPSQSAGAEDDDEFD